jgi:hypothetical protein
MNLPDRPKPRQNETRDLTRPIIVALNKIEGVRVVRNVDRGLMVPARLIHLPNPPKVLTGLGKGGSDIVGVVKLDMQIDLGPIQFKSIGRLFTLEIKYHGRTKTRHAPDQARWRRSVQLLGGFAGLIVARNEDEGIRMAVEAVERCRRGESE